MRLLQVTEGLVAAPFPPPLPWGAGGRSTPPRPAGPPWGVRLIRTYFWVCATGSVLFNPAVMSEKAWDQTPPYELIILGILAAWAATWPRLTKGLLVEDSTAWSRSMGILYASTFWHIGHIAEAAARFPHQILPSLFQSGFMRALALLEMGDLIITRTYLVLSVALMCLTIWLFRRSESFRVARGWRWRFILREGGICAVLTLAMFLAERMFLSFH